MSVTHVAGPVVSVRGRVIQRCAVCGEKLADSRNVAIAANPDGTPGEYATWAEAHLLEFEGNRQSDAGEFRGPAPLPANFCLALVE